MAKIRERTKQLEKYHNYKATINHEESFVNTLAPVFFVAQMFGFFPIFGASNRFKNVASIRFKSFKMLYCIIWFTSTIALTLLELNRLIKSGYASVQSLGGILFYLTNLTTAVLLFKFALKFPTIIQIWNNVEEKFLCEPYKFPGWPLKKRIRYLALLIFVLGFFEHFLSHMSFLYDRYQQAKICKWEIGDPIGYYITTHLSHVFTVFPFNLPFGLWIEFVNFSITIVWNFVDLLIMIISLGITYRFEQINSRLEYFQGRIISERVWEQIRIHYVSLCELQEYLDIQLAGLIIVASFSDLYSICSAFLNIAVARPYAINTFYFWYSFLYLIGRTLAMFIIASKIHDESKAPLKVFRSIPSEGWHSETERFSNQVQSETIALSGMKFFTLTRSLVITIAGTVVTYELVLLQFDAEKGGPGMWEPCGVKKVD